MRSNKLLAAALGMTVGALAIADPAEAGRRPGRDRDNGLAAGAIGFAAGAILGGALASPRYSAPYYEQAPVYVAPAPVYVAPAPVYVAPPVYPGPVYYNRELWSEGWYSYCGQRYRSFNYSTGYFLGYDGQNHFCR